MPYLKDRFILFLRWSERYTKTDMVYLTHGGLWAGIAQVISSGALFLFAFVVSHYLPKEVYGEYKYILAVVGLLGTLSLSGLGSAVLQSVSAGHEGSLYVGFWTNIRWSAAVFLGSLTLALYYLIGGNTTLAFGILIGGCLSPILTSANLAGSFLVGKKDFKHYALYFGIIETLLSMGSLIFTIFLTQNTLILVGVYFLSNTLATLWLYRRVIRMYAPKKDNHDPGMLLYSKHLSFMNILLGIAGSIDEVLTFHFLGPAQLAIYSFAIAIPDQIKGPIKTLQLMLQRNYTVRPDHEIQAGMRHKSIVIFISTLLIISLYVVSAPFIYRTFFPEYTTAALYSQVYALSLVGFAFLPAGSYLVAKKRVREQYLSNTIVSILQILILVAGVTMWGLWGMIAARILTRVIWNATPLFFARAPLKSEI